MSKQQKISLISHFKMVSVRISTSDQSVSTSRRSGEQSSLKGNAHFQRVFQLIWKIGRITKLDLSELLRNGVDPEAK